jgi:surface protein
VSFTFTLPISQPAANETVSFLVAWGDGTQEVFVFDGNNWSGQDFSHFYSSDILKTIKIYPPLGGKFGKHWNFKQANATGSAAQMRTITKWGGFEFCASGGSFKDCINLDFNTPTGTPAITWPNSLHSAFSGCASLSPNPTDLQGWDTSAATTFYETFLGCINFNAGVDAWNPSGVTNTTRMFAECAAFNRSLNNWNTGGRNVSNLEIASGMFRGATSFNMSLSGWDVSNISFFSSFFEGATSFNQDIGDWDTGEATDFSSMFKGVTSFNKDISEWNTSKVTNFNSMFEGATSFNKNINTGAEINKHGGPYNPWTIRSDVAVTMDNVLNGASAFDQDISDWDVANISSATNLLTGTNLSIANALEINDSSTGWPSQGGASAAATNESAAAVQASGTIPVITSHTAAGGTIISNPENTQTVVNLVAAGSPVPTFSTAGGGDVSKFSLINTGDGEATLKLSPVPDFENPTDSIASGSNTYGINISASNEVGSGTHFFNFNVTDVSDVAAPVINTLSLSNATSDGFIANWDSIGAGYTYHYQVATDSGFSNIINDIDNYSGLEVVQVSLAADTTYYFRVKAEGGGVNSTYEVDSPSWDSASIETLGAALLAPTGDLVLSVDNSISVPGSLAGPAEHHQVFYKGTYVPGADQLIIQASTSPDFTDGVLTLQGSSANAEFSDWTLFSHVSMQAETEYYFRYQGKTNSGIESDWSTTVGPLKTDIDSPSTNASYYLEVESFEANEDAAGNWGAGTGNSPILSTAAVHSPSDYWMPIRVKLKSSAAWSNHPHVKWEVLAKEVGVADYSLQVPPNALDNTAPSGGTWQIYEVTDEVNGVAGGGSRGSGGTGYPSTANLCLKPETQYSIKARMVWKDRPWESDEWIGAWVSGTTYMNAGIHARHIVGEDNEPFAAKEITITTPPARSAPDVTSVQTSTVYSWSAALIGGYSNGLPMGDNASFDDWRGDKKITFSFSRPGAHGARSFLWQLAVDPNFENLVAECGASEYWAGNHYFNDDDYSYQPGSNEGARLFLPTRNVGSIDVAKCYDLANGFLDGDWVTVDEGTTFELDWALQPATTYYFRTRCLPLGIHWDNALAASLGATYPDAAGWSLETNPGSWGQGNAYGQYDDTGLPYARATTGTPAVISYASVHEGPMVGGGTADTMFLYVLGFAMQNGTTITVQHYAGGNWNTVESWNTVIGNWHSGKTEIVTGGGNGAGNNTDVNEAGETIGYPAVQRVMYGPRGGPIEWNSEPSEDSYHVSRHYQFEASNFSISAGDTMKIKVEHGGGILEEKEIIVN